MAPDKGKIKTANEQKAEDAQAVPIAARTPGSTKWQPPRDYSGVTTLNMIAETNAIIDDQRNHIALPGKAFLDEYGRIITSPSTSGLAAAELNRNVEKLRAQVAQLQTELANNTQTEHIQSLEQKVQELATVAAQVQARSTELTAPVIIPTSEDMRIHLVPAHSLERLEEYRSDESRYMLIAGIFGGAIAAILVNWFTSEQFTMTKSSEVLLGLLVLLVIGCGYRIYQTNQRAAKVKSRMWHSEPPTSTQPPPRPPTE